jgi:vacuolar-type H+-ATPase subunit H
MRRQRIDFQDQVKRTQAEREAIEDVEAGNTSIDAYISSDSDDEVTKSILELILLHVQSSSLLVFPQTSRLRKWC